MQGAGNDYIYVDCFKTPIDDPVKASITVSDRHFGVGGDGLILICPSEVADVRMRMFNADGSEGNMCGNGIRCVGKFTYERGLCKKETLTVETKTGIKTLKLNLKDGIVQSVRVDMGKPEIEAKKVPVITEQEQLINAPVEIDGKTYRITCVSMGNPHAVIFTTGIDELELDRIGPKFDFHPMFPERVNTEFVEVIDDHTLKMRVWERGSGETLACGTGTCATVVAACLNGHTKQGEDVLVHLRGGDITINWQDNVIMTGPAEFVFDGEMEI